MVDSTSQAKRDLEALRREIDALEKASSSYVEQPELIQQKLTKALIANQTAAISVGMAAGEPRLPMPPMERHSHAPSRLPTGTTTRAPVEAAVEGQAPPPPRRTTECLIPKDPLLEDSMVTMLTGEGHSADYALAAVKATGCTTIAAAKSWLQEHKHPVGTGVRAARLLKGSGGGGSSGGGLQGVEQERPPPAPVNPMVLELLNQSRQSSSNSIGATPQRQVAQEGSNLWGSATPTPTPRKDTVVLPWLPKSPARSVVGNVALQVRGLDGELVVLEGKFHPLDSLRTVLNEFMRQSSTYPDAPERLIVVVPHPPKTTSYGWAATEAVTLEAAGVGTRATLMIQMKK